MEKDRPQQYDQGVVVITYLRIPIKRKPKRPTPRHIIIKMAKFKDKERILKAAREKPEVT